MSYFGGSEHAVDDTLRAMEKRGALTCGVFIAENAGESLCPASFEDKGRRILRMYVLQDVR